MRRPLRGRLHRRFVRRGVNIDLSGEIEGEVVLAFDEQGRRAITDELVPADDPEKKRSSIEEVGNIMSSGFVDGWANYLNAKIKNSPPTYIEGTAEESIAEIRESIEAGDDGDAVAAGDTADDDADAAVDGHEVPLEALAEDVDLEDDAQLYRAVIDIDNEDAPHVDAMFVLDATNDEYDLVRTVPGPTTDEQSVSECSVNTHHTQLRATRTKTVGCHVLRVRENGLRTRYREIDFEPSLTTDSTSSAVSSATSPGIVRFNAAAAEA